MSTEDETKYRPVGSMYGHESDDEADKKYGELNPLQLAAKTGDMEQVKALVTEGKIDINENNYERYCAVNLAAEFSHWDIVDYLVQNRADLNNYTTSAYHISPLYFATVEGNVEQVKKLLLSGALVNDVYSANHEHLLHIAIRNKQPEIVKVLLEAQSIVNPQLPEGRKDTPLSLAILLGQTDIIPLLQKYGAKLPSDDQEDLRKGLYSFIQVSSNPKASFEAAFSMVNEEGKPYYGSESIALGLYGCLRSRRPAEEYIQMLLDYNTKHSFDGVNTAIPLSSSWISLLVNFDEAKVAAAMEGSQEVNGEATKNFTPYELAVLKGDTKLIDMIKPFASEATIANAAQYVQ